MPDRDTPGADPSRRRIDFGLTPEDLGPRLHGSRAATARRMLPISWPAGDEPRPAELPEEPDPGDPLPRADVLVVTWTAAEVLALADVLTPGVSPRTRWYRYDRGFEQLLPQIRPGAPARVARRLGSYYPTRVGDTSVLCFKSELHLNQDGVRTGAGRATLPVAAMTRDILGQVRPRLVLTVGTSGAVYAAHGLGDVVVTRGAKFVLEQEFAKEPFADTAYRSSAEIPTARLATATTLMRALAGNVREPDFGPPTKAYGAEGPLLAGPHNRPSIHVDGQDLPEYHPILSTDAFIFGTSDNGLDRVGCGVEMGDAVFGLVAEQMASHAGEAAVPWLVVRNLSNPAVNGDLPTEPIDMQAHWASWYYEQFGYWTSVNSAIVAWAVIAA
ncbi:MAG TPA: hypothetical protein VFJ97_07355 [Dermatophilaceae bacterium]|nr:hypothetical protein [Dermatophilaceae bacterium]